MRIMRWICSYTRQDRTRNTIIREKVGVAPIVEKMLKLCLRWFGHMWGRPTVGQ